MIFMIRSPYRSSFYITLLELRDKLHSFRSENEVKFVFNAVWNAAEGIYLPLMVFDNLTSWFNVSTQPRVITAKLQGQSSVTVIPPHSSKPPDHNKDSPLKSIEKSPSLEHLLLPQIPRNKGLQCAPIDSMRAVLPGKPRAKLQAVCTGYWDSRRLIVSWNQRANDLYMQFPR